MRVPLSCQTQPLPLYSYIQTKNLKLDEISPYQLCKGDIESILSRLGSHRNEMGSWVSWHEEGALQPCLIQFGIMSVKILTQFLPLNTNKSFQTVCFGPFISLGSIRTMFLIYISKFLQGKRFAPSLGIKESKAPGLWSLLQHHSPKSIFACFQLWNRKLCGIQVI